MSSSAARLTALLAAYPVAGVALLRADRAAEDGWDVVTRGDGLRVRIDFLPAATDVQKVAARALVLAADLSDAEARVLRAAADALLSSDAGAVPKALRSFALAALDEVNGLRSWCTSLAAAVAAASTLADLKTRVAALPALPQRTKSQLLNAATGHVDAGDAD